MKVLVSIQSKTDDPRSSKPAEPILMDLSDVLSYVETKVSYDSIVIISPISVYNG